MLRRHRAMALCGVAAFFAYAYFYQAGGWNQNTRFDLVRAIVEHRGIQIDDYQENSGDKAAFEGHFYADKAPGASFTAAPVVALARAGMRLFHANARSRANLLRLSYIASLAAAAVPGAIAVMCVWAAARRLGANALGSTVVALTFGLGTPFWAWSTVFYSHALSAACLLGAFLVAIAVGDDGATPARDVRRGLAIGFLVGWAVVTEFPAALPGAVIVLMALARAWPGGMRRLGRVAFGIGLAGGACAVALGAYHYAAFHDPFHVAYASEQDSTLLKNGFFGITSPKLSILGELLWGSFRGLLPLAPVLILVPVGWGLWAWRVRSCSTCRIGLAAALAFLLTLALIASYEHWEGGWSFGPRQLGPALGFAALGLVPVWMKGGRAGRALVLALALAGLGATLVGVSTTAQPPAPDPHAPMSELLWPAFREGHLSLNSQSYLDYAPEGGRPSAGNIDAPRAQWNVGELMGLRGLPSLLPLAAGLTVLIGLALRSRE